MGGTWLLILNVDMTFVVKCRELSGLVFLSCTSKGSQEMEPVMTTVDHADIRGLVTTLLVSVGRLPRI